MFIDSAAIYVKAGNGGNGCISFRREKFVPAGGPDGGDGGSGGSVILRGDGGLHTLGDFRYKRKYVAQNGAPGASSNRAGKSGDDLIIRVPLGSLIYDAATGRLLSDITADGQTAVVVKGGKGGAGNQHFATPTRQIPAFAKSGDEGGELHVNIELKVLADVGLVGFPNVGKSTLLSVVSSAKPKIADYHFTTLSPNLGVVDMGGDGGSGFVMADIPGLIEGAHEGIGLGDAFLKHIERTRLLLHIVDIAGAEGRDPVEDYNVINAELKNYKVDLSQKPQIVVANKIDAIQWDEPEITRGGPGAERLEALRLKAGLTGRRVYAISAATGQGVRELLSAVSETLNALREAGRPEASGVNAAHDEPVLYTIKQQAPRFELNIVGGIYILTGQWLKKLSADTNYGDHESLQYFQTMLKKYGIIDALVTHGINEGDTVKIYDIEFDYIR